MRKTALLSAALAVAALAFSAGASAQDAIKNANNQLRFSWATGTDFDYKKTDADGLTSGENGGSQNGVSITFVNQRDWGTLTDMYFAANVSYLKGDTKYKGWMLAPGSSTWTSAEGKTDYKAVDFDVKVGKGFKISPQAQVTPYVNIGTRTWDRDSVSDGGYLEKHSNSFYGVGAMFQYAATANLVLSADAMFAKNTSSELDWVTGGEKYSMKNKGTNQFGFGANYRLTKDVSLFADYRITETKFGAGSPFRGYVEPANKTKTQRLNVGVAVNF